MLGIREPFLENGVAVPTAGSRAEWVIRTSREFVVIRGDKILLATVHTGGVKFYSAIDWHYVSLTVEVARLRHDVSNTRRARVFPIHTAQHSCSRLGHYRLKIRVLVTAFGH